MDKAVIHLILVTEKIEVAVREGEPLPSHEAFLIRQCARELLNVVPEPVTEPDPSQFLIPF